MKPTKLTLILFLILNSIFLFAQEKSYPEIDSALLYTHHNFHKEGKLKEGILFNLKLLKLSKKHKYTKGIGWSYLNIGNLFCTLSNYNESLKYLDLAEKELYKIQDPFLKTKVNIELGKVHHFLGLYEVALDYYNKAIIEAKKNTELKAKKNQLNYVYACKADNFEYLNQYDSLLFYFQKAYDLNQNPITAANIANYFIVYKNQEIDSAAYYLEMAAHQLKTGKNYDLFQKLVVLNKYGDFYFKKKEYNQALDSYLQSIEIAKKIRNADQKKSLYQLISKTYKALQDEDKAIDYLQKFTILNDSLESANKKALNFSIEKLVKDQEFENEREKANLNLKNNYIIVSIIILSLVLVAIIYVKLQRSALKKRRIIEEQEIKLSEKRFKIEEREIEIEKLKNQVNDTFQEVIQLAKKNDPSFLARFKEVYPEFCQKILELYPDILNSELMFCAYLKLNFSTKEIANYTFVTEKAVQGRKSRIRKRFNIPSEEDLYIWMNKI